MGIRTKGLIHLDTGYYDKISLCEKGVGNFMIDVNGISPIETVKSNVDIFEEQKKIEDVDKIISLVDRYLNEYKINGITDKMKLPRSRSDWALVYGNFGKKVLRLQLLSNQLDVVEQMILKKYLQDRYNYCWSEDIRFIKINLSSNVSKYDVSMKECNRCEYSDNCDFEQCINLNEFVLKTDKDGSVLDFEKEFIKEFLYYLFSKYDDKVVYYEFLSKTISGYNIECGDIRIYIPNNKELLFIFDIVDEYNKELSEVKENDKKRQLKMEGF